MLNIIVMKMLKDTRVKIISKAFVAYINILIQ